jgi:hypothetical protein
MWFVFPQIAGLGQSPGGAPDEATERLLASEHQVNAGGSRPTTRNVAADTSAVITRH